MATITTDMMPKTEALVTADGRPLKQALAEAQSRARRRAFLLVAPLLAFILLTFVFPIGQMLYRSIYNPAFSGELKVPLDMLVALPLDERKIIARRCAFELPMGGVVNLGIGMPEGVAPVANEEKVLGYVTLTAEPGVIGGLPQSGLDFGAAINTDAIIHQSQQFVFTTAAASTWRAWAWRRSTRKAT